VLTQTMAYSDGDVLEWAKHGQPKIEPEIAFIMGRDLAGDVSPAEALLAVDGICGALEVIDSRYVNFDFTLNDVVADNASSRSYILGSKVRKVGEVELGNLGMVLKTNGHTVAVGSSAAILEHPARSLARLSKMLARHGQGIKAGQVVLAGAATAAVTFTQGMHVRVEIDGLGAVETSMDA
jgi:2-oxo-3-hexenedioate decarboxylase